MRVKEFVVGREKCYDGLGGGGGVAYTSTVGAESERSYGGKKEGL